jgi:hypothetical protein
MQTSVAIQVVLSDYQLAKRILGFLVCSNSLLSTYEKCTNNKQSHDWLTHETSNASSQKRERERKVSRSHQGSRSDALWEELEEALSEMKMFS